jgi:SAM-dependent methyltransferase
MDGRGKGQELEVHGEVEIASLEAASAFEEIFVPALFREWGPKVAGAARVERGDRVLDVACGTGVLARAAAEITGPSGSVVGLDIDPGMLAVAKRMAPRIAWHQGDAGSLPFPDRSFDAVVSQFGLMFFPDRPAALREMWRVLRPGGRMAVAVWASLDETPAYAIEADLIERFGGRAAGDVVRAPFVLGDKARLAAAFSEAGIPDVSVTTVAGTGRFPDIRTMVEIDLLGWLPTVGIELDEPVISEILRAAESELRRFVTGDGHVEFASPGHIVTSARR